MSLPSERKNNCLHIQISCAWFMLLFCLHKQGLDSVAWRISQRNFTMTFPTVLNVMWLNDIYERIMNNNKRYRKLVTWNGLSEHKNWWKWMKYQMESRWREREKESNWVDFIFSRISQKLIKKWYRCTGFLVLLSECPQRIFPADVRRVIWMNVFDCKTALLHTVKR